MSWLPGAIVTFSADDTAQQLINSLAPVAAIRFRHWPGNAHRFYWGTNALNPINLSGGAPNPLGVLGYLDPPVASSPGNPAIPSRTEDLAANPYNVGDSVDPTTVYVSGKEGEIVLWSYKTITGSPYAGLPLVKNTGGQTLHFFMRNASSPLIGIAGTPTVNVFIDGSGSPVTGTGTWTAETGYTGRWIYTPSQAETNGTALEFVASLSGALDDNQRVYTHT